MGERPIRVMSIFGTRPEAIKMAPVVGALENAPGSFISRVAVTAQHREMLDQVLDWFGIQPDYDLDIMQPDQSLSDVIVRALKGLEEVLAGEQPDLVLVHGDTSTTFAGALAAYYRKIPVGHVEAGLRTNDKYQPFPEEINRRLTGVLTDLHFAPTLLAKRNLLAENAPPESIFVTGNTVVDALLETVKRKYTFTDPVLKGLIGQARRILLVTAHRRENHGAPLREICLALRDLAEHYPDVAVVYPVHPNPQVVEVAHAVLKGRERIFLMDPLSYEAMAHLMKISYLVLTDSGGLQEEAPGLGKPVLVLREVTERPEGVEAGTLKVVGTRRARIYGEAARLLEDEQAYRRMARAVNPYGDGQAARRIVEALAYHFGLAGRRPEEFQR